MGTRPSIVSDATLTARQNQRIRRSVVTAWPERVVSATVRVTPSLGDEHARVEDAGGVELGLDRPQHPHPDRADLGLQPLRWSVPTAWWWVIVAPWATIASLAARLAARHCASGSCGLARRRS